MSSVGTAARSAGAAVRLGLSGRLMLLTVGFVMLAEVLIFVPSIANFRNAWLRDRLAAARTATLALEAAPANMLPEALVIQLLDSVGSRTIAHRSGGVRRLLAVSDMPLSVARDFDLRSGIGPHTIAEALDTLFSHGNRLVRVIGPAADSGDFIEMVIEEKPLRDAMRGFSVNILLLSLLISSITAALVYFALHRLIVRPVKRLAEAITAFGAENGDQRPVIAPSGRGDEIGEAEVRLAAMQRALANELRQRQNLAALGLAVAKINHDLRNMLSAAHLLSDRIASVPDPTVQRIAPKLIRALDRAVGFCQATLAFGKLQEPAPQPKKVDLNQLADDLRDLLGLGEDGPVAFLVDMPQPMPATADPEQLLRVLLNLGRNSVEAMTALPGGGTLTLAARRAGEMIEIEIADTGPGVPEALKPRLFQPFAGAGRPGGTGLGLAIAADLMRAQGGSIALVDVPRGACFRIALPG